MSIRLLSVKELSEIINVKTSTLYQWAELGQIPCHKLNGALRFLEEDILKWIGDCKRQPVGEYNVLTGRRPRKEGRQNGPV